MNARGAPKGAPEAASATTRTRADSNLTDPHDVDTCWVRALAVAHQEALRRGDRRAARALLDVYLELAGLATSGRNAA